MRLTALLWCVSKLPKDYSNFPESYIKRSMEQIYWKTPKGLQYRRKTIKRNRFYFGIDRPWTKEFQEQNMPGSVPERVWVEPIKEWTVFRGDRVEILVGKDKGKQGLVNYIVKERNWVCVEGLNCNYKFVGQTKSFPGMMIKDEAPLMVTDQVSLVDPSDNKPTTVEWRFTEDGTKVRVSVRTGRILPLPRAAAETYDYKSKHLYIEKPKDTTAAEVEKVTFNAKLTTFEEDIMKNMGMKEDRRPFLTYWY